MNSKLKTAYSVCIQNLTVFCYIYLNICISQKYKSNVKENKYYSQFYRQTIFFCHISFSQHRYYELNEKVSINFIKHIKVSSW